MSRLRPSIVHYNQTRDRTGDERPGVQLLFNQAVQVGRFSANDRCAVVQASPTDSTTSRGSDGAGAFRRKALPITNRQTGPDKVPRNGWSDGRGIMVEGDLSRHPRCGFGR